MRRDSVNNSSSTQSETLTFEMAFARLEGILEKMNSGSIPLDEALKLYEEADRLIVLCQKRLNEAERKVEILIKNRNGELTLDSDETPQTQDFAMSGHSPIR